MVLEWREMNLSSTQQGEKKRMRIMTSGVIADYLLLILYQTKHFRVAESRRE